MRKTAIFRMKFVNIIFTFLLLVCVLNPEVLVYAKDNSVKLSDLVSLIQNPDPIESLMIKDNSIVYFKYDANNNRIEKNYNNKITNYKYLNDVLILESGFYGEIQISI